MDIEKFISIRQTHWKRLEQLLDKMESSPAWEIKHEEMEELVKLYRQACSDLNQVRTYTASPEAIDQLNLLTGRAYRLVYQGTRRQSFRDAAKQFFTHDVPRVFQEQRLCILAAFLAFVLGATFGSVAILVNPDYGRALIPADFFTESPKERVEKIEKEEERIDTMEEATGFAASLYVHNIQVGFLVFCLAALTIVGGQLLLFYNGAIFGMIATLYFLDGQGQFFISWVGPHGALELPAIIFTGAAGLILGQAFLMPGDYKRAVTLRRAFEPVWKIMLASTIILVAAGLIEGSFSQFSQKTIPYGIKIAAAAILLLVLISYLFFKKPKDDKGKI